MTMRVKRVNMDEAGTVVTLGHPEIPKELGEDDARISAWDSEHRPFIFTDANGYTRDDVCMIVYRDHSWAIGDAVLLTLDIPEAR